MRVEGETSCSRVSEQEERERERVTCRRNLRLKYWLRICFCFPSSSCKVSQAEKRFVYREKREEGERERALQDHSLPSGSGTRNHRRMSAACAAAAARPALMLVCRSCRLPSSCARESTGRHADARQTCVLRESHVEGRRPSTPAPALAHTPSRVSLCVHRVILASLLAAQLVTHSH